jgi:hypothetical protein
MITLYKLFDLTGIHQHSKTRWFRKNFGYTTKQAKSVEFVSYKIAYDFLVAHSKKPDVTRLYKFFPESINAIQSNDITPNTIKLEFEKKSEESKMLEIKASESDEKCKICQKFNGKVCWTEGHCMDYDEFLEREPELPKITKDDYKVLTNSFDDLVEMIHLLEQRILILEKRLELPQRSFRNEVITLVNDIARKHNRKQRDVYKEVYQGFDSRFNLKEKTKHIETSYLEWYDKNEFMPKLLNYIKETYKV